MKILKSYIILLLLFSGIILGCSDHRRQTNAEQELINTDKGFNQMCREKGMAASFVFYADDSVIKLSDGNFPVIGKKNLEIAMAKSKNKLALQWEPLKAMASKSGDLGFTFGNWKLPIGDTVLYGNYVSIWKRQTDGSWKYILDGGNSSPKP